jgi:preprotein translocase SecE subunit
MNLEIYKKGQGKTARTTAYALIGILVLFGAYRLHATFNVPGEGVLVASKIPVIGQITVMKIISILAFCVGLLLMHIVLNGTQMATLLIDTEQEMRKVTWPSRAEIKSATLVVVIVTFVMALSLFGFDHGLQRLFSFIF